MKKRAWKTKIKKACKEAGTYKPYFDYVIDTLAGLLERRDDARTRFEEGDEDLIVEFTNKGGATNIVKNPIIAIMEDCDKTALSYWRELGLTPAGLKKINEEVFSSKNDKKTGNNLMQLLEMKKAN